MLLFKRWFANQATGAELEELKSLSAEFVNDADMKEALKSEWNSFSTNSKYTPSQVKNLADTIVAMRPVAKVHRIHFLRTAWFRVAAVILFAIGIGAYLWNLKPHQNPVVKQNQPVPAKNDTLPGNNNAILTLSNGQRIELTDRTTEIEEAGIKIGNIDGGLSYKKTEVAVLNMMSTPRGGQYRLTLSDGTKVWLNAASSITYPTAFTGKKRSVTVSGEAYFEVAKDASKPFIVKTAKEKIEVLGTYFNVNAYADEPVNKISLLEGSVRINNVVLKPGQAFINGNIVTTDVQQDVAWKSGYFNFNGANLPAVMRQLERWYDIEVKYPENVKDQKFRGKLPRNLSLSQVLNILKDVNVNYKIKDRTLFIE